MLQLLYVLQEKYFKILLIVEIKILETFMHFKIFSHAINMYINVPNEIGM